MSKKDDLILSLIPLLSDREKLETFLMQNSNLPSPRANLELVFALLEIYTDVNILIEWSKISEEQVNTNEPKSFLTFCSAICLGISYVKNKNIFKTLKKLANDGRWRIREGVAFGFQIIGESDFDSLTEIFNKWIKNSNNLEKRAILVSLAHPKFLNKKNANYCFEITDHILSNLRIDEDFVAFKKGLDFTISVFVVANHEIGFEFIENLLGKSSLFALLGYKVTSLYIP